MNMARVPFADPPWLRDLPSPIYNASHRRWQKACRAFIEEHLLANAFEWDDDGQVPEHVFATFAKSNMLVPSLPAPLPVEWLRRIGVHELLGELKVEEFDYIHMMIYTDEMSRSGLAGPPSSLTTGVSFGIPPILKFGSEELKARVLPDLLRGTKRICIAITEPGAGSDVANIETTATLSKDGQTYAVNGSKKWITTGIWSDYATMAVRTGGAGPAGLSLLLVPLKARGVSMRRLRVGGQRSGGTTFIELDDVAVPAGNLIGAAGQGMKYMMTNFNHERLAIAVGAARQARVALSAAFAYVTKRRAFGAPLVDQPVVRHRLAKAGAGLESLWAWTEQFVYQMTRMPKDEADAELGGLTALCKAQAGRVLAECAECAVLLFGGSGYTSGGQGEVAERIYREVMGIRIPGGSEDVLLDLAVRQLLKNFRAKEHAEEKTKL